MALSTQLATRQTKAIWPPSLSYEIALGLYPLDEVLQRHGVEPAEWYQIKDHPTFRSELAAAHREVVESGMSFKRKAAIQAEMYLEEMDLLMGNPDVAPSTKVDIFKTLAKLGELEPAPRKSDDGPSQMFNIQINL